MDSLGYSIGLDERNYELKVYVPPELKQLMQTYIGHQPDVRGLLVQPALFSFYMNMNSVQYGRCSERLYRDAIHGQMNDESPYDCSREPFVLDLDGAMAFHQWILEGSSKVTEPRKGQDFESKNVRRGNVRLLREMEPLSSRLSFGDVDGASNQVLNYEGLGGVQYEYNPRFFAKNIFLERYKIRFLLPRPAQVEIQVDGNTIHRLRLPSGSHEISGFSGHRGSNTVQVYMTQEDGTFSALPYEYVLGDARNLLHGETQYSLSGGIRRTISVQGYDYLLQEPGLNAHWMHGLLPNFTAGIYGQGSLRNLLLGSQLGWSPDSVRWIEVYVAANYADSTELGHKTQISYTSQFDRTNFSIATFYQSKVFDPGLFPLTSKMNQVRIGLTASAGMNIPGGGISVSAGISQNRQIEGYEYFPIGYNYGANLSQNFYGVSFNAAANASVINGVIDPYISANISYMFGVGNHSFMVKDEVARRSRYVPPTYQLKSDSSLQYLVEGEPEFIEMPGHTKYEWKNSISAGWNWAEGGSLNGAQSYSASITNQEEFSYGRLWAQHFFNRARTSASYNLSDYDATYLTMRSHSINVNLGTSLMFADGVWAFGRPVDRGFILAKPQNGLTGSSVHINHSEYYDADFSQSGWLGAAYYNQISNYRPNEIQISLTDVPMGSWLEQDRYYTMGAYKQGYAVRLGSAARVLMRVRLIDETKQPMDYVYVTIGQIDEKGEMMEKRATFTSKDGVLQMGNLHPGHKYRIHFGADSYIKDIDVMVPRGSGALFTLPDIQVEHKQLDMSMTKRSQASLGKPQPPASPAVERPSSLPLPMQVPAPAAPVTEELPPSIAPPASANY